MSYIIHKTPVPPGRSYSYYKMWAGLKGFDPRNDLVFGDRHGLHESSYCYFEVYAGTRNLNSKTVHKLTTQREDTNRRTSSMATATTATTWQ